MQKFWSILFGAVMLGALLLFVVAPFVGWWLPKNVATFGGGIDALFYVILVVTAIFFVLTEAILVYTMYRFAGRPGQKASYVHTHHKLEMIWTLVPGVLLFLLAVVQINVWAEVKFQKNMPKPDGTTQQMEVMAKQWEWRVRYPSSKTMESWEKEPKLAEKYDQKPDIEDVHISNEIHVWKGSKVLVHLKTRDVIHSFFLPNLRLKQDALPGKTIPVWFSVTEHNTEKVMDPAAVTPIAAAIATIAAIPTPIAAVAAITTAVATAAATPSTGGARWVEIGGYDRITNKPNRPDMIWELACAEFCGTRHSMMRGKLYVHKDKADFLEWLKHAEAEQNRHELAQAPVAAR